MGKLCLPRLTESELGTYVSPNEYELTVSCWVQERGLALSPSNAT